MPRAANKGGSPDDFAVAVADAENQLTASPELPAAFEAKIAGLELELSKIRALLDDTNSALERAISRADTARDSSVKSFRRAAAAEHRLRLQTPLLLHLMKEEANATADED